MYIHIDIYVYMYISFVLYNIYIHSFFRQQSEKCLKKSKKVTNVTKGIAGSHSILLLLFIFLIISSNIFKISYLQKTQQSMPVK